MPKSFYLTKEAIEKLKAELSSLESKKEQKIKDERFLIRYDKVTDPDYVNFYEELDGIKAKIRELHGILINAKTIEPSGSIVNIGSKVKIEDTAERESLDLQIVETIEADPARGKISPQSPFGSALFGHRLLDIVFVPGPVKREYRIKEIQYG